MAGWLRPPLFPSPAGLIGVAVELPDTLAEVDDGPAVGVVVFTTILVVVDEAGVTVTTVELDIVGSGVEAVGAGGGVLDVEDVEVGVGDGDDVSG